MYYHCRECEDQPDAVLQSIGQMRISEEHSAALYQRELDQATRQEAAAALKRLQRAYGL